MRERLIKLARALTKEAGPGQFTFSNARTDPALQIAPAGPYAPNTAATQAKNLQANAASPKGAANVMQDSRNSVSYQGDPYRSQQAATAYQNMANNGDTVKPPKL